MTTDNDSMTTRTDTYLIGTTDAAIHLGLSKSAVTNLVNQGKLTPIGLLGTRGIRVFRYVDVDALAQERARA